MLSCFSCVWLCDSMVCSPPGSRQEHWNVLPSSPPDRPNPGIECLLHWQADSLLLVPPGKPIYIHIYLLGVPYMLETIGAPSPAPSGRGRLSAGCHVPVTPHCQGGSLGLQGSRLQARLGGEAGLFTLWAHSSPGLQTSRPPQRGSPWFLLLLSTVLGHGSLSSHTQEIKQERINQETCHHTGCSSGSHFPFDMPAVVYSHNPQALWFSVRSTTFTAASERSVSVNLLYFGWCWKLISHSKDLWTSPGNGSLAWDGCRTGRRKGLRSGHEPWRPRAHFAITTTKAPAMETELYRQGHEMSPVGCYAGPLSHQGSPLQLYF